MNRIRQHARKRFSPRAIASWALIVSAATLLVRSPAGAEVADEGKGGEDARTMEVCVRDEGGKPIDGATIHVSIWEVEGERGDFPNMDYTTNSDGVANISLPRRLRILRLWPSKPGYVPEFVNFAQGSHEEGNLIPDQYEFKLARGTELGGAVVDQNGQPIAGVKVQVRVDFDESPRGVHPDPRISTHLTSFNNAPSFTDAQGRWKIINAPAKGEGQDFRFRLKVTHREYISDSEWGKLQDEQAVTTELLRDGSATLVLKRGVSLMGEVVDANDDPVSEGMIFWQDVRFFDGGKYQAQIDTAGRFTTIPLSPGEYPLTIIVPGHQPARHEVTVAEGMKNLRIALQPGKRLAIKVVDAQGKPIPQAYVGPKEWRGTEAFYALRQFRATAELVPIPRRADGDGLYVWDWAPGDAVTYQISAKGFASNAVTLIATEAEHVVELLPRLIASGRVTDATTGKPIESFRVIPVTVFRPKFFSTALQDTVQGKDGQFEIELADDREGDYRYQVRIEADGYRSAISEESFEVGDGLVTQDFALEPAEPREGRVVDQKGEPVASATVVEGTPSIVPLTFNTKLDKDVRRIKTTPDGQFRLASTFEPVRIRVTHESGFAEVVRQPDEAIETIQLQPWASVSGRLLQDGHPIPDESIYFYPVPPSRLGEPRFQDSYHTQTDADGRFEFERLPPITGSLKASLGPWQDSPLTSSQAVALKLTPGEQRRLTLGGRGIAVTGKVVTTGRGDAELNKNWSLNYLISRDRGIPLPSGFPELSFDPSGPVQASWFLDPDGNDWLATRESYFVKLAPDGKLHVSGVLPGTYDLVLRLYEQPAGCLVETIGHKVVAIEVTESDSALGTKNVGTIEVACRSGPRVGENMKIYEFTDTSGRRRSIRDMNGRYVLMHVWASWCAPCLESMPDIQATIENLSEQPLTVVGLNIDKDASKGQALAEGRGWNWSQSFLGDDSDMARQLAISSVPTYFLIGPDGLLVASNTEWLKIKDSMGTALRGSQD